MYVNADMGESFGIWKMGDDELIMPHIDIANIACGFHASDPLNITKTVSLAKKYNKLISAHISYPDLVGFGRRSMKLAKEEIKALLIYQCGALDAICKAQDKMVKFIKPHGALYNDMMENETIFVSIIEAISEYKPKLKLFVLANVSSRYKELADDFGITLFQESFADRNYGDDGYLLPRSDKNALILDVDTISHNLQNAKDCDTISIHSDHKPSIEALKLFRESL